MPFGVGQRRCVGQILGIYIPLLILKQLAQNYTVDQLPKTLPEPVAKLSLRPAINLNPRFSQLKGAKLARG